MLDKIFALINDLTDNQTLIIVFLFVMVLLQKDANITDTVVGGMLGYLTAKGTNGKGP